MMSEGSFLVRLLFCEFLKDSVAQDDVYIDK